MANSDFEGKRVVVKQVRSAIGYPKRTKATIKALGLGKLNREREFVLNSALAGMIKRVRYLVEVKAVE